MSALIVTLRLDPASFDRLDALRRAHFPPALNHLRAHVTLFHALPEEAVAQVRDTLAAAAARAPFGLSFPGVRRLGRGVAAEVDAPELGRLRAELATAFRARLTPQDAQGFRPHVTVQNKVSADEARLLKARLAAEWSAWTGRAEGLLLHRYLGGPWALEAEFPFRG